MRQRLATTNRAAAGPGTGTHAHTHAGKNKNRNTVNIVSFLDNVESQVLNQITDLLTALQVPKKLI